MFHQDKTRIFLNTWLAVGHIPRQISRHCYIFLKEGGNITGHLICTNYKSISDSYWWFRGSIAANFFVKNERIFELMKSFFNDLYEYNYAGQQAKNNKEESSNNEEIYIQITIEENGTNENNKSFIEID